MTGNKKLIYAALFAALCCVITMYPKFPTLFGYIHAGDALVLLAAYVLGPLWGSLAAALGSSLADLMAGYVQYFPGTFVIKGLDALVAALIFKAMGRTSAAAIVSGVVGEIIMVVGYFGYAGLLLGKGIAAASIPGNLVQAAMGLVIGFVLLKVMQKTRIAEKI